MAVKMTDAFVRSASAKDGKRTSYMDSKEPGLELRVLSDGRKAFALRRSVEGRDVRLTLGRYGPPPLMSLEGARGAAAALKVRLRNEGDFRSSEEAAREKQAEARSFTVGACIDAWLKHAGRTLRASTLALHTHRLEKHVRPALGSKPLGDVTRADVRELVNALGETGKVVTANKTAQLINTLYRFARSELERDVPNPATDLKPFKEAARERVLSDDELKAFWAGLNNPDFPPGPLAALALKVCLYSAQRGGEVAGMRDSELDFEERLWKVPGERTKSGRPNRVPLTPALIEYIKQAQDLRARERDEHGKPKPLAPDAPVFAAIYPGEPLRRHSLSQGMARLCGKLDWETPATPHDLRRSARTIMSRERLGISSEDAERVMSHVTGSQVSRVYVVNDFLPQKRRALERLAVELDRIIAGQPVEVPTNVVELEERRA